MRVGAVFGFWLGRLDTQVATGNVPAGVGTRDIRFCAVGKALRRFLLRRPSPGGHWDIRLEPCPEAGIPEWQLRISEYRFRGRECALPGQSPTSTRPYPAYRLWQQRVRVLRRGQRPTDCIVLMRDENRLFHARVIRSEELRYLPEALRLTLLERDECGRVLEFPNPVAFMDLPIKGSNFDDVAIVSVPRHETRRQHLERIAKLGAPAGTAEARVRRRLRSRRLAEELKRLYGYRCQLCHHIAPRIDMGNDRFYVEVHHILGISEVEDPMGEDQESAVFSLDNYKNIVVVCPHHHRLLHYYKSPIIFRHTARKFVSKDGSLSLRLRVDHQLRRR